MKICLAYMLLIMPYLAKAPVFDTMPEPTVYNKECLENLVWYMRLQAGNSVSEKYLLDKLEQPNYYLMKKKCRR